MMGIGDMKYFSTHRKSFSTNKKGFTLIELAIVMIIVGLLLTIGMSMIGPLTKRAKLIEARENIKAAKEAVVGWTVKNGFLPADIASTGGKNIDSWGKEIAFIRAAEIDAVTENVCRTIGANNRTNLNVCLNGDCAAQLVQNVAFVVASGSDNYNIQTWTSAGGACPVGETCVLIYTTDTPTIDDCTDAGSCPTAATQANDPDRLETYDDVVQYVSLDEIRASMGCSQPLVVTSPATLPDGEEDSFYSYSVQGTGGRPPYTWAPAFVVPPVLTFNINNGLMSGTINLNNVAPNTGELIECQGPPYTANNSIIVTATLNDFVDSTPVPFAATIPVRPKPLTITNTEMPTATVGTTYTATLNGTGGRPSNYNWCVAGPCNILPGLTLSSAGQITGTPTTPGTYGFTVTLTDGCAGGTISKGFTITVNPREGFYCTLSATPGTLNSGNTTNLNYAVYNYQVSPPNATLNFTSSVAGTLGNCPVIPGPGSSVSAITSPYTGLCQSGALSSTTSFTLTFTDAAGKQTSCSTTAFVGPTTTVPPSCNLTASPNPITSGQTTTLSWNILNGPANITCTSSPTAGLCPAADCNPSGSYGGNCTTSAVTSNTTFQLTAANANGNGMCATTVYLSSLSCPALFNTTPNPLSAGYQTVPYSRNITYTGGFAPVTCSIATGSLPPGLSLAGCTISGTPTSTGTYNFTARVADSCGIQQTKDQATSIRTFGSIILRNTTGGARRYKRNGGACTAWNNNTDITVLPADTYQIATSAANCTANNFCATTNFAGQYPLDVDADGLTRMNNPCVFADR